MLPYRALRALPPALLATLALALIWVAPASAAAPVPAPVPLSVRDALTAPAPIVITGVFTVRDQPLTPGTTAIVRADGGCLRLRDGAGLSANVVTCLSEGSAVMVMAPAQLEGEYRWQLVLVGDRVGWVADEFLVPAGDASACSDTGAPRSSVRPGLAGSLPADGIGAAVWGGGTTSGIVTAALMQGCNATSLWAQRTDSGRLVGYLTQVPQWVNRDWQAQFADGVPAGTIVFVACSAALSEATIPILLSAATATAPTLSRAAAPPEIAGRAGVVIDGASGAVLYEHNAHRRLAPASLTKIATAIVAVEGAEPGQWVDNQDVDYRRMPGSSVMGLVPGDCYPLRDLLYGLMLPSGNDAALAIARWVGGGDEIFTRAMNTLVARLGLQDTAFRDPHGLGGNGHYSSAYDLAMLARYGLTLPLFQELVSTPSWTTQGSRALKMATVNRFLTSYPGADGLKTGFTEEAGRTLAVSATRDGHRLIAVLLHDPDRFPDAQALMDWAFANYRWP